jgi:hypothetical protein
MSAPGFMDPIMPYPTRLESWLADIETPSSGGAGSCLQSKVTLGYLVLPGDYCGVVGLPALTSRESYREPCLTSRASRRSCAFSVAFAYGVTAKRPVTIATLKPILAVFMISFSLDSFESKNTCDFYDTSPQSVNHADQLL